VTDVVVGVAEAWCVEQGRGQRVMDN